ncbi:MAG TPA: nucleotidyltransferase [Terriglobales bacterium]|jgi:hypothetical protein|nr:nucleotidyltransferase [Terriglobales bacterium]
MAGDVSKIPESSSVTSAIEVPLPPEASTLYREVLEAMNQHELPYAVAGAFALQKYTGISRITKDLDLFMKASDIPAALEYLKQLGFRCETPDPVWLSKAHRGDYFVDLISGMSNAVIVVDDSWMKRTLPAMIAGVPSRIISVEDLLGSKLFVVRRERFDGADIAHIIYRTRGQLNWDRVLKLAGEHWEMVLWALVLFRYVYPAQTHYVPLPLWRDLLGRFMHAIEHPNPDASFRGSLVDDNMFSIDMKDWGLPDLEAKYRARALRARPDAVFPQAEQRAAGIRER